VFPEKEPDESAWDCATFSGNVLAPTPNQERDNKYATCIDRRWNVGVLLVGEHNEAGTSGVWKLTALPIGVMMGSWEMHRARNHGGKFC